MRAHRPGAAITVAAALIIAAATLTPSPGTVATTRWWCIACGDFGLLDLLNNIALFMPLGLGLALAGVRRGRVAITSLAYTIFIEAMQVSVVVGRDASLSDVLANTLGGYLGAELARWSAVLLAPGAAAATRLAVGWAAVLAAILSSASAGFAPADVPRFLWVQREPARPPLQPFAGRLVAFDVDGLALDGGLIPPSAGLDRRLRRDAWDASALVTLSAPPTKRSVIVRIAQISAITLSVEQHRAALRCRVRVRASELRFRTPLVTLGDAFEVGENGSTGTFRLTCGRRPAHLVAASERAGMVDELALRLSPSLGWAFVAPYDVALDGEHRWVGVLWMLALALPGGYWVGALLYPASRDEQTAAGRGRRAAVSVLALLAALAIGCVVAPAVWDIAAAAWWDWAAALGGIGLGVIVARAVRDLWRNVTEDGRPVA